jgi:hypothetical protein
MTVLPIAPEYRKGFWLSLGLQLLITLIMATILDDGRIANIGASTMIGFWIGAIVIVLKRPLRPTRTDMFYVRWGFPLMLALAIAGAAVFAGMG